MRSRIIQSVIVLLVAAGCALAQDNPNKPNGGGLTGNTQCVAISVDPSQSSTVTIQVTGTWTATLQPQLSVRGQAAVNTQVAPKGSTTLQGTITANGVYSADVSGVDFFQVCTTAYTSGTANIFLNLSTEHGRASMRA